MTNSRRRSFLKSSAGLVSGLAISGCRPESTATSEAAAETLPRATLDALAEIVLPESALGADGVSRVVEGFGEWLAGFEPVAERNHAYLWTDEIHYGPPDPAPRFRAELEALELESTKRHETSFTDLTRGERRAILERQLPKDAPRDLPYAGDATHVALGLLAYFYQTSEANDLGHQAAIERQTCRGLDTAPDEPAALAPRRG